MSFDHQEPKRSYGTNTSVQRRAAGKQSKTERVYGNVQRRAQEGIEAPGGALPHVETIQKSFGKHDVGGVEAHIGGRAADAAEAIGAEAYALGTHVAFRGTPDLHTAAHEAAHVVQQRAGVSLKGGVGQTGDTYEQHADRVADLVVSGQSAEAELDHLPGGSGTGVQCDTGNPLDTQKHKERTEDFDPSTIGALEDQVCEDGDPDNASCFLPTDRRTRLIGEMKQRIAAATENYKLAINEEKIITRLNKADSTLWLMAIDILYVVGSGAAAMVLKRLAGMTNVIKGGFVTKYHIDPIAKVPVAVTEFVDDATVSTLSAKQIAGIDTVIRSSIRSARAAAKSHVMSASEADNDKVSFLTQLQSKLTMQAQAIGNYAEANLNDIEMILLTAYYDAQDHSIEHYYEELEAVLSAFKEDVQDLSDKIEMGRGRAAVRVNGPFADLGPGGSRVAICSLTYGTPKFLRWAHASMEDLAAEKTARAVGGETLEKSWKEIIFFEDDDAEASFNAWVNTPPQWRPPTTDEEGNTTETEIVWPER